MDAGTTFGAGVTYQGRGLFSAPNGVWLCRVPAVRYPRWARCVIYSTTLLGHLPAGILRCAANDSTAAANDGTA